MEATCGTMQDDALGMRIGTGVDGGLAGTPAGPSGQDGGSRRHAV
jgi:hypothetical protein